MATCNDMYQRFVSLDINKEAVKVVVDHKKDFISFNQQQLLDSGVDSDGKKLMKYQSESYAKQKNRRNPLPGLWQPDLYDTGAFFESMKLEIINEKKYRIYATDTKTKSLIKKYGSSILGLGIDSRVEIIKDFFRREFMANVKQTLKL